MYSIRNIVKYGYFVRYAARHFWAYYIASNNISSFHHSYIYCIVFVINAPYLLARAGPLLGAERAGPGGCLNTPRLARLMGHVAPRD